MQIFNDSPIKSCSEDILGRKLFSERVAKSITGNKSDKSIVYGILGSWGFGKTSVINMILEEIQDDTGGKEIPIIIHFNPWIFSDQNQIIHQFFAVLSNELKLKNYGDDAIKAGDMLVRYSKFFKPLKLIPGVGPFVDILETIFESAGDAAKDWGEMKKDDLDSLKKSLNEILFKLKRKIIVVIDDIDRLSSKEIRIVFQLIKSIADFDNIIYILAFDRKVVAKSLDSLQEGYGDEYIEKIVQYPFCLPEISRSVLSTYFANYLEKSGIIPQISAEDWGRHYKDNWIKIYGLGFSQLFSSLRDVKRFIMTAFSEFELVKDDVNFVDYFALSSLKMFVPGVYEWIKRNKKLVTGEVKVDFKDTETKKEVREEFIIAISDSLKNKNFLQGDFREMVCNIFPKLYTVLFDGPGGITDSPNNPALKRVHNPDFFGRYFELSLHPDEISGVEWKHIMEMSRNIADLSAYFRKVTLNQNKSKNLVDIFNQNRENVFALDEEYLLNLLKVMLEYSDRFPSYGESSMFDISCQWKLLFFIEGMIKKMNISKQYISIVSILNFCKSSIVVPTYFVHYLMDDSKENGSIIKLSTEEKNEVISIMVGKIRKFKEEGKLLGIESMETVLINWQEWSSREEVLNFVKDSSSGNKDFLSLISGFINYRFSNSLGSYSTNKSLYINRNSLEKFFDIEELNKKIEKVEKDSLEIDEQKIINILKEALAGSSV